MADLAFGVAECIVHAVVGLALVVQFNYIENWLKLPVDQSQSVAATSVSSRKLASCNMSASFCITTPLRVLCLL